MEKYIGIITAIDEEFKEIKNILNDIRVNKIYELEFYEGIINNRRAVLVECGIGKVNSARVTQILTDKYDLDFIINTGSAGGLNNNLKIGDLVVATELVQHDFNTMVFGDERGYISGTGKFFKSDKNLIKKCKNIKSNNYEVLFGRIASGDIFCTKVKMKEKIKAEFNCDCVEMEGASIAQVCYLNKIPFIVIRSISDIPNEKNKEDFEKYIKYASKNCAEFIEYLFKT